MKKIILITVILSIAAGVSLYFFLSAWDQKYPFSKKDYSEEMVQLPAPRLDGSVSVEKALHGRRSVRNFENVPMTLNELSQLLWAAQGITDQEGFRTAPSAGATYPLEIYVIAGNTQGFHQGIYKYQPYDHSMARIKKGDQRKSLLKGLPGQEWVEKAPVIIVIAADPARTLSRYGEAAMKYIYMETGHASENVYLEAEALKLGTTAVAAFEPEIIKSMVGLTATEQPLYLMPVGKKTK